MHLEQFSSLQHITNLRHALTTRDGGFSTGPYNSLNLGFHVGDEAATVRNNRQHLGEFLGLEASTLIAAQQVHGAQCTVVTQKDCGRGALDWESAIPDTDALIVAEAQVPVMILVADCAPILIVDPAHEVLAVVHAGWRGAAAGIAGKTLQQMQHTFEAQPQSTLAAIGPCLCLDCLEIGEEVAVQIPNTFIARRKQWPKPHLDLRQLIAHDLEQSGVAHMNIEISPECPRCLNAKYFSHRAQNGTAGRFGIVAWWE